MLEFYNNFRGAIVDFIESLGLNAIYTSTVIVLIIVAYHWKNYRNWEDLSKDEKGVLKALIFAAVVGVFVSTLNLVGYFEN